MFSYVKDKVAQVQAKSWAQPLGQALGVTAKIVDVVGGFVPGVGFIGGALELASELLNPEPTLEDLKREITEIKEDLQDDRQISARARKLLEKEKRDLEIALQNMDETQTEIRTDIVAVRKDVQTGFKRLSGDLNTIQKDVSDIKNQISATYDEVCDLQYRNGIDRIEAAYQVFSKGSGDVAKAVDRFHQFAMEIQTEYAQSMKTDKITRFLKIIYEKDGADACQALYDHILVIRGKYLQLITLYAIYKGEPGLVEAEFEQFNADFQEFKQNFDKIMAGPKLTDRRTDRTKALTDTFSSLAVGRDHHSPTAGVPTYPETITLSGDGPAADRVPSYRGVYTQEEGAGRNGRPVWKKIYNNMVTEKFLFYSSAARWMIGPDPQETGGWILSNKTHLISIPTSGWQFVNASDDWQDDDDIKCEAGVPTYPETITVSGAGPGADKHPSCMGVFRKEEGAGRNGRPVWRKVNSQLERFVFYSSAARWMIGSNPQETGGWILSNKYHLISIPTSGWQYHDGKDFHDDPQIVFV